MKKQARFNPLQIKIDVVSLPRRVKPETFHKRLLAAIDSGEDLPRGWNVQISWRNPATKNGRTKNWQTDEFTDALSNSSAGFRNVAKRAILNAMGRN